jgi:hypothetical protein
MRIIFILTFSLVLFNSLSRSASPVTGNDFMEDVEAIYKSLADAHIEDPSYQTIMPRRDSHEEKDPLRAQLLSIESRDSTGSVVVSDGKQKLPLAKLCYGVVSVVSLAVILMLVLFRHKL